LCIRKSKYHAGNLKNISKVVEVLYLFKSVLCMKYYNRDVNRKKPDNQAEEQRVENVMEFAILIVLIALFVFFFVKILFF
jgi:hypothetical protein